MNAFDPADVRLDLIRPASLGGQQVGPRLYPMQATHIPTGASVTVPAGLCGRSQHRQRQLAMEALEWIILNAD